MFCGAGRGAGRVVGGAGSGSGSGSAPARAPAPARSRSQALVPAPRPALLRRVRRWRSCGGSALVDGEDVLDATEADRDGTVTTSGDSSVATAVLLDVLGGAACSDGDAHAADQRRAGHGGREHGGAASEANAHVLHCRIRPADDRGPGRDVPRDFTWSESRTHGPRPRASAAPACGCADQPGRHRSALLWPEGSAPGTFGRLDARECHATRDAGPAADRAEGAADAG